MRLTRFEWMTLTKFVVAAWVAFLGGVVKHAQAQIPYPVPPPPPPIFNPSSPYTLPSTRQVPVCQDCQPRFRTHHTWAWNCHRRAIS